MAQNRNRDRICDAADQAQLLREAIGLQAAMQVIKPCSGSTHTTQRRTVGRITEKARRSRRVPFSPVDLARRSSPIESDVLRLRPE